MRGGWGCDAAWADDFHHALRVLLTGDREGYYAEFGALADLAKAFHRPHVHDGTYSTFRRRRFGARPTTSRPSASSSSRRTTTRSATARSATGCRSRRAPLAAFCTLLSPFTPMLFLGEEHGEDAPFQFFSDHIDEEIAAATREGRRREFAAFAEFRGERGARPAGPGDLRGLQAHARGRARRAARPLRRAAARPPRPAAGRRRQRRVRRARRLAARAPRAVPAASPTSRARDSHVPLDAHRRARRWPPTTSRSSPATSTLPAAVGRAAAANVTAVRDVWPGRPFPLGATWDGQGTNFSLFSENAERVELCLFDDDGRRGADRGARAHRVQLARVPAGRRARAALRLPRPRAVRPARRPPLQPRTSC